ncbi:MAG TPA: spore coat U domain-containing protein [Methylomirabilota bacterium]|nr:spore coat U domain-containing protein [Methylomirabilota bacterium]
MKGPVMTITRLLTIVITASAVLIPLAAEAACNVNTTAVTFGTYNVFTAAPEDATGRVRIRCNVTRPPSVTVHLDKGGAPSFTPRQMRKGTEALDYNLYQDSTRTVIWGDGTGGSQTFVLPNPPLNTNIDVTVYGRIPAGQDVSSGSYSSTVTATIFF